MDKNIKAQKKDLEKLQEQIETLENERRKLKKDEDSLARTLKRLESEMELSTRKQVRIARQIREAESQVKRAERDIRFFSGESARWDEAVVGEIRAYYVSAVHAQPFKASPMERWAMREDIRQKYLNMKSADSRRTMASDRERRLQASRKKLSELQAKLQDEQRKQKEAQAEKKKLYQTTQGKRAVAEQEAQRLRETAEGMEQVISSLIRRKEQTLSAQREAEEAKKALDERRGSLPWPVEGSVTVKFGRQKHPDLNIMVINNGIRIQSRQGSPVGAVDRGKVVYASDFRSYGQTVILDHGGDNYTVYGLLGDILVKDEEKVKAGQPLGTTGPDGQVYFEFRSQGHTENPLLWLRPN